MGGPEFSILVWEEGEAGAEAGEGGGGKEDNGAEERGFRCFLEK